MKEVVEWQGTLSPRRNQGIDLLRGISIVLVVLHHLGLRIPLRQGVLSSFLPRWILDALIFNGYEAVFIFFVISGFIITSNSINLWGKLASLQLRVFYARRAVRIVPCLLVLVAVLAGLHLFGVEDFTIFRAGQTLSRTLFSALFLHLNWYEGHTGWLPGAWSVLWSLSIEEAFYLAFPLVCLVLRRDSILMLALALLALSLPASRAALAGRPIWQEMAYLPGMAGIALGVWGAIFAARVQPRQKWILPTLAIVGILGLVSVLCVERWLWALLGNGTMLVLTCSVLALILVFHWRSQLGANGVITGTGWLCSFGRLSYEIYLSHMFVVLILVRVFKACGVSLRWGILWYVPTLALSWLLGLTVSRCLSLPRESPLRQYLIRD